jgi:hypothetical protein
MKTARIKVKRAVFFTKAAVITALALLANSAMAESDIIIPLPKHNDQKAVAVYAPRPQYPYEARARHITGRGVFALHLISMAS